MVIQIKNLLNHCYTYEDGLVVLETIKSALNNNDVIQVSFEDITAASSSFINGAFVPLLDLIGFDSIRARIKVVDSIAGINKLIKSRLMDEDNKRKNGFENAEGSKRLCISF